MQTRWYFVARVFLALGVLVASLPNTAHGQAQEQSQPACRNRVVVMPGDTLASIARRCDTTMRALIAANPGLDPNMIRPGVIIHLESATPERPPAWRDRGPSERYTVRPGDTLFSISRQMGISVPAILGLNPHVDPRYLRVGEVLRLPGRQAPEGPRERVTIDPARGEPGTLVTVSGSDFDRNARLVLMIGSNPRRMRELDRVRADWRGRVHTTARVPDWAARRDSIFFALESLSSGELAVSQPFRVLASPPDRPSRVVVSGTLTRTGVECPAMHGDDGRTYTFLGDLGRFRPGDRVRVEGRTVQMSFCMQGTTVEVSRIQPAE